MHANLTGKIARLPKATRDAINHMIQDGVPDQKIIDSLGGLARKRDLNCHHLARWRQDGYQDWLQQPVDEVKAGFTRPASRARQKQRGATDTQEIALRLAGSQICQILKGFKIEPLKELLENDPGNFPAMTKSLAKLSKVAFDIEKFNEKVAEEKRKLAAEAEKNKPRPVLTREAIRKMEKALKLL